jgi:hypothetical protein
MVQARSHHLPMLTQSVPASLKAERLISFDRSLLRVTLYSTQIRIEKVSSAKVSLLKDESVSMAPLKELPEKSAWSNLSDRRLTLSRIHFLNTVPEKSIPIPNSGDGIGPLG